MPSTGDDRRVAYAEHQELLAEAAELRRFPKTRLTLKMRVARWVLILGAMALLVALWVLTKPG